MNNARIADRLLALAQLLAAQKENPFKVKAYRRAAATIKTLAESVDELVRAGADLTVFAGIGKAIDSAIREIVLSGTTGQIESLRAAISPELAELSEYPRLDPQRVRRIYKKLDLSSVAQLQAALETGAIRGKLGMRMEQHVRQALIPSTQMLLYRAHDLVDAVNQFLRNQGSVTRAEVTGEYRRKVEVIGTLSFLIETPDFPAVIARVRQYGGSAELLTESETSAVFQLASGTVLRLDTSRQDTWGLAMIMATGSDEHLRTLARLTPLQQTVADGGSFATEDVIYQRLGIRFIEPELREGNDEVALAREGNLPVLVAAEDIRGELHAHSTSSDGAHSIEQMAAGAMAKGYEYLGITDHSQSLKIARGLSERDLWEQIRFIDELNGRLSGIRILKAAEVDILAGGELDYPDELLRELDYTICSIHSRFALDGPTQTGRLLRAMDNRYCTIIGHATGRLLLTRPSYDLYMDRVIGHARASGCCFEINSSPNRLDLSAVHARQARMAGVKIAITTDAHSIREYDLIRCGIEQARRAGLDKAAVLNCLTLTDLQRHLRR